MVWNGASNKQTNDVLKKSRNTKWWTQMASAQNSWLNFYAIWRHHPQCCCRSFNILGVTGEGQSEKTKQKTLGLNGVKRAKVYAIVIKEKNFSNIFLNLIYRRSPLIWIVILKPINWKRRFTDFTVCINASLFLFVCLYKLMAIGVNGASGVYVLRLSVAYKQGQGNVRIQSLEIMENLAVDTAQL